eukprot:5301961-Amphidinium_carterae.1
MSGSSQQTHGYFLRVGCTALLGHTIGPAGSLGKRSCTLAVHEVLRHACLSGSISHPLECAALPKI